MNKNLIIKNDPLGRFVVCPYCNKPVVNLNWYQAYLTLNKNKTLGQTIVNRYNVEIKYCSHCGNKLNWVNLQKQLLKEVQHEIRIKPHIQR